MLLVATQLSGGPDGQSIDKCTLSRRGLIEELRTRGVIVLDDLQRFRNELTAESLIPEAEAGTKGSLRVYHDALEKLLNNPDLGPDRDEWLRRFVDQAIARLVTATQPVLRIGSGGPLVQSIQEQLRRDGFLTGGLDGVFDRQTEQAVRAFQERADLPSDGMVGPNTWRAFAEAGLDPASLEPTRPRGARPPQPFLRMGSRGPHVGATQAHLGLTPTTVFNGATEEAVRAFQERAGLATDGIVGQRTWAALLRSGLNAGDLPPFGRDEDLAMSDAVREDR